MNTPLRSFQSHAEIKTFERGKDASGAPGLIIQGYASTKDLDRVGEIVEPEAFKDSLAEYLDNPIVTYMHDWSNPIGKSLEARIDETGLWVKVFISASAEKVIKLIEEGILRAFSIGFQIAEEKEFEGVNHILRLRLYEIAVVSIPANQRCLFDVAKALRRGTDIVFEELPEKESQKDEAEVICDPRAWMIQESFGEKFISALHDAGTLAGRTQELIEETRSARTAFLIKELKNEIGEVKAALKR